MAAKTLYLGPSFPSVAAMPAPSRFERNEAKRGPANEAADGTLYAHQMGIKGEWTMEWDEIDSTDLGTLRTEYKRTRSLAMVDLESVSWTVIAVFQGMRVKWIEGTNPPLFNVQMMFREH